MPIGQKLRIIKRDMWNEYNTKLCQSGEIYEKLYKINRINITKIHVNRVMFIWQNLVNN